MNRFAKETFIFTANLITFFDIAIKKDTFSTNILKKCGNRLKKHAKDLNAAKDSINDKVIKDIKDIKDIKVFKDSKDLKDLNWIQRVYFSKAIRWGKQASRREDERASRREGERDGEFWRRSSKPAKSSMLYLT